MVIIPAIVESANWFEAYSASCPYLYANIIVEDAVGAAAAMSTMLIIIGSAPNIVIGTNNAASRTGTISSLNA